MALFSPLTTRRSTASRAKATQQLIVFRLRDERFALPIRAVQKVIPMGKTFGAPSEGGVSLTLYQERELLVIDIEHRIFKEAWSQKALPASTSDVRTLTEPYNATAQRYLLLVEGSSGKMAGLPIDSPPSLQRVPESAFTPLSASYISQGNIRCVSALIVLNNNEPPLFLLNLERLVQPHQALPPAIG